MSRRMINAQISPLSVSVDSQDIIDDLMKYKERALLTHIVKVLTKFMLRATAPYQSTHHYNDFGLLA